MISMTKKPSKRRLETTGKLYGRIDNAVKKAGWHFRCPDYPMSRSPDLRRLLNLPAATLLKAFHHEYFRDLPVVTVYVVPAIWSYISWPYIAHAGFV